VRREETSAYDVSKATATVSNKAASRLHLDLICSRATALCELAGNRRVNRRRTLAQERRAILARLACDGMRV
jgi:hypothetical protein